MAEVQSAPPQSPPGDAPAEDGNQTAAAAEGQQPAAPAPVPVGSAPPPAGSGAPALGSVPPVAPVQPPMSTSSSVVQPPAGTAEAVTQPTREHQDAVNASAAAMNTGGEQGKGVDENSGWEKEGKMLRVMAVHHPLRCPRTGTLVRTDATDCRGTAWLKIQIESGMIVEVPPPK